MKPILKTEYVNLPLSIPAPWREFFDEHASRLGISRNAALCLALKLGGPILGKFVGVLKDQLRLQYERLGKVSENLGPPALAPVRAELPHERRKRTSKAR